MHLKNCLGKARHATTKSHMYVNLEYEEAYGPAKFKTRTLYHTQSTAIVMCENKNSKITTLYMLQHTGYIYLYTC